MDSLFALAVQQARAHGRATLAKSGDVCTCAAYRFPHRPGGGRCHPDDSDGCRSRQEIEAEMNANMDADSARYVNGSGAW